MPGVKRQPYRHPERGTKEHPDCEFIRFIAVLAQPGCPVLIVELPRNLRRSSADPVRISMHAAQVPHGSGVGPCSQLRHRAMMRAAVVLPTPRMPVKRKACAIRPLLSACAKVRVTCSCPTSSLNRSGRHLRASTRWDDGKAAMCMCQEFCPSNDSQAPLRHRVGAGTVASFRTWRGSRPSLAQDPAISDGQFFTVCKSSRAPRSRGPAAGAFSTISPCA